MIASLATEKERRCKVAVWAYAYELENVSLVDDATFDLTCRAIDTAVATDRPDLDVWFKSTFDPSTGLWVHKHPELRRLKTIVRGILSSHARDGVNDV